MRWSGYVAPANKLAGRETEIFAERDRKLTEARERRARKRQLAADASGMSLRASGTEKGGSGGLGKRGLVSPNPRNIRGAAAPLIHQQEPNNQSPFNSLTLRSDNSNSR
jgi:hypothetical protein